MVTNLNGIDRKVTLLTAKDIKAMRVNIVNRLIDVLLDYAKLPDIEKDEKRQILESVKELKDNIGCFGG